jgi:hypothetical protein
MQSHFFRLEGNGHMLFWLGIQHSRDIKHPQFDEIGAKWSEFLELAKSPLIVVEGHPMDSKYASRDRAVEHGGEVGFMESLARRDGVPIKCFEPYRDLEMNYVAGLFGKEKTAYYYFGRAVAQLYRVVGKGNLEEYLRPFRTMSLNISKENLFTFSIPSVIDGFSYTSEPP